MSDRESLDDFARRLRAAEIKHRDILHAYYLRKIKAELAAAQTQAVALVFSFTKTGGGDWIGTWRPA